MISNEAAKQALCLYEKGYSLEELARLLGITVVNMQQVINDASAKR